MIQILLGILLILIVGYFIKSMLRHQQLALKEDELEKVELESDLLEIDKNIAQERAHQREIEKEINELKQRNDK